MNVSLKEDIYLDIGVLTYNHSEYIEQCIYSLLEQKTNYKYRIIVLDDNSTDDTKDKLLKIYNKFKDKIVLIFNKENLGPLKSAKKLFETSSGKYSCFLDGDDYWCNDNKIQTQVDFLENNPEYAGCFHDAKILQENNFNEPDFLKKTQNQWKTYSQFNRYTNDFMPWSLIHRNIIPTASLIYRNANIAEFLKHYKASEFSLSWALHLEIIKNSKFKYFNEIWSVYRDHSEGFSKKYSIKDFKLNNIKILEDLLSDSNWKYYKADIYQSICSEYRLLIKSENINIKTFKEYKSLLKNYKKYLNKSLKTDLRQLKLDYFYVRNNRMVE